MHGTFEIFLERLRGARYSCLKIGFWNDSKQSLLAKLKLFAKLSYSKVPNKRSGLNKRSDGKKWSKLISVAVLISVADGKISCHNLNKTSFIVYKGFHSDVSAKIQT